MSHELTSDAARRFEKRPGDTNLRSVPQMNEYEAAAARIARDRPDRVLDWGCGWGQMAHLMRRAGLEVAAFEYREGQGSGTERLERFPEIEAQVSGDPRRLPYDDAEFDAALSMGVLEHVQDPEASLDELRRVLRPGGTLYVYKLPNRYSYLERIAKALGYPYHGAGRYDRLYTVRSARELVEGHGFEVLSCRRANMLPLTLTGRAATALAAPIWWTNRGLSRMPVVNLIATNVELIASVPRPG
jgi:2-polyprenyl-3-methyl-5-hydroxy-6-metoxy-1,4-benzoquinol methylase